MTSELNSNHWKLNAIPTIRGFIYFALPTKVTHEASLYEWWTSRCSERLLKGFWKAELKKSSLSCVHYWKLQEEMIFISINCLFFVQIISNENKPTLNENWMYIYLNGGLEVLNWGWRPTSWCRHPNLFHKEEKLLYLADKLLKFSVVQVVNPAKIFAPHPRLPPFISLSLWFYAGFTKLEGLKLQPCYASFAALRCDDHNRWSAHASLF